VAYLGAGKLLGVFSTCASRFARFEDHRVFGSCRDGFGNSAGILAEHDEMAPQLISSPVVTTQRMASL
jgi:hypothetical protein